MIFLLVLPAIYTQFMFQPAKHQCAAAIKKVETYQVDSDGVAINVTADPLQ
jgi:hypothetical protein